MTAIAVSGASIAFAAGPAVAEPGPDGSLYGSIAVYADPDQTVVGAGWNYPSWEQADLRALGECGMVGCKVLSRFRDGCGAVAESGDGMLLHGGSGRNRFEAERDALGKLAAAAPPPSPLAAFGSSAPGSGPGRIIAVECTGNAG